MPVLLRPRLSRRRISRKSLLFGIQCFILVSVLSAQEQGIIFSVQPGEKYRVIEKFNLSQYKNGRYTGHVYRENRGIFETRSSGSDHFQIEGTIYHLEEKAKDGFKTASALRGSEESSYSMNSRGTMLVSGSSFPRLRNFPTFPDEAVRVGQKWEGGIEVVIPSPDGESRAVLPQYCEYTFLGEDVWEGRKVYVIKAQYAVRYKSGRSPDADRFLKALSGKHVVSLLIDQESREFLLMKDIMEEEYLYHDGSTLREKGFLLTFYKGIELLDRPGLMNDVKTILSEDQFAEDDMVSIEERDEGLALTLKNLHFEADKAILLEEDRPLLDTIASILKRIPDRTFLVKGHTADVGSMESQISLSQDRARSIVDELSRRGIDADRFLFSGMGGLEPIGDNGNEEGRRKNRRVEILILED